MTGIAPGRVNLIGEHVDYNGGRCLPIALTQVTRATVTPRDDAVVRVLSGSRSWEGRAGRLDEAEQWASYVTGVLLALEVDHGVDVEVSSDVPIGAGLSSSAALECSVALALDEVFDLGRSHEEIVAACVRAEQEYVGAPTGGLDQAIAVYGEASQALLIDFASGSREQVPFDPSAHGLALLVIDTKVSHELTDGGYASRRADCEEAAATLGLDSLREATEQDLDRLEGRTRARAKHIVTEITRVDATVAAITQGDWERVGALFDESHASMRDDFEISTPELDLVVETARAHGALGARMTGGGFGGSAISLVPTDAVARAADAIASAFAEQGWDAPASLTAPASAGAGPVDA